MKKSIFNLLFLLITVTAASQTMPTVRVAHSQRQKSLYVEDSRPTNMRHRQTLNNNPQARHIQARCLRKEKIGDGIYKNLYQCSVAGVWNKQMSEYAPTWTTYVTFDENAGTATFTNLAGFDGGAYVTPATVTAPMSKGTITLPCSTYDGSDGSTLLGDYWGLPVYLYAGDYDASSGSILADDKLEFKVAADYSTLRTDDKAMAIVYTYKDQLTPLCYVSKPLFDMANETASSEISTDKINFGKTTPGNKVAGKFNLVSTGTKDVDYTVSIDNPAFQLDGDAKSSVEALQTKEINITFAPTSAGDYNGTATVTTSEATYTVALSGKCVEVPTDFSSVFTSGDASLLTWDNTSDFPWSISEQNQAVPGNLGQQPKFDEEEYEKCEEAGIAYNPMFNSTLKASYNSQSALRLSFDMFLDDDPADSLRMEVDGMKLYAYSSGSKNPYAYSCVLPKGKHTFSWNFATTLWAEKNANVYISNMRIEPVDEWADVVKAGDLKFLAIDMTNIGGKAYSKSSDAVFLAETETSSDKYVSFEYPEGRKDIFVELTSYTDDNTQELSTDGSGKLGCTIPAGFNGNISIYVPKDAYITEVRSGEGKYESMKHTYQIVGTSYYSTSGAYLADGGYKFNYPCDVTFDTDGLVRFDGLFIANDSYYPNHNIIKGRIGTDGKIHIPAKQDFNEGTLYGWDNETFLDPASSIGRRYWLMAGPVVNNTPEPKDELVISMSGDKMLLTADDAFGVWATTNCYTLSTSMEYWMPGTRFFASVDGYSLLLDPEKIDFGATYPDIDVTKTTTITNNGKDNTVKPAIEGAQKDFFKLYTRNTNVESLSSMDCIVKFQASAPGEYSAELKLYNDGETVTVPLHATVNKTPDYSAIVDEGADKIEWKAASTYAWTIDGDKAYSSNKGIMSSHSAIIASVDVPEGNTGTISFQAAAYPEPGYDSFRFYDGDSIACFSEVRNDSIVYQHVLSAGHHDLKFDFYKDNIDETYFVGDYASLSHIRLNISPSAADDARLYIPEASFTELVPVGDTYFGNAYIVNTGKNKLTVYSAEGDSHFNARLNGQPTCNPGDTLMVYTTFSADEVGTYNGTVKFNTSAGTLSLPLQATADNVVYLADKDSYNYGFPYPTAWTDRGYSNVNVQSIFNEDMTEELKGRDLTEMTYFSYVIADAPLSCPDVTYQIGTVSKPAVYDTEATGLTTVYSGVQPEISDYEMTIPFDEPFHFEGGHLETQLLLRGKEEFQLQFPFLSTNVDDEYPQCSGVTAKGELSTEAILPYVRFRYAPKATGIKGTKDAAQKEVKTTRIYNASGVQLNKLQHGLNIIVTTYTDGSTHTTRQIIR